MPPTSILFPAIIIGIGCNFPWAYHSGLVNSIGPAVLNILNESYQRQNVTVTPETISQQWSIGVNIFLFGGFFGALPATIIAEKLGRKNGILASCCLSILGSLMCCLWPLFDRFQLFMAGRFVLGFHGGLSLVLSSIYISESAMAQHRGFLGSQQNSTMSFWAALAAILGMPNILGVGKGIYVLMALPGVVSFVFIFVFCRFPDSPKFLYLGKKDEEKAQKSAEFFYKDAQINTTFMSELNDEKVSMKDQTESNNSWIHLVRNAPNTVYYGIAVALVVIWSSAFTGVVGIVNFSTLIFIETGMDEQTAIIASVVLLVVNCVFSWIGPFTVARVKRRKLLLSGLLGTTLANILFICVSELNVAKPQFCLSWCNWVKIVTVMVFIAVFQIGIGSVTLFLPTELVPQSFRSFTQSGCMSSLNVVFIATGFALLPLSHHIRTLSMLVLYVVPNVFCILFLYLFQPETKNKNIAEVQKSLQRKFGRFFK